MRTKTTIIVCWAGLSVDPDHEQGLGEPASTAGLYDPAALYTIHIDNNGDNVADHKIYWRYGQNGAGDTGIQWTGLPGSEDRSSHAVETVYEDASGARTWSGHADDPFFFDAEGYLDDPRDRDPLVRQHARHARRSERHRRRHRARHQRGGPRRVPGLGNREPEGELT